MVIPTPTIRTAAPGGRLVDRWTPTHTVSYDRGDQSITHSSYDSTEETVDVEDYLSDTDASVEVMPTGKRERSHDESQSPPPSKKTRPDAELEEARQIIVELRQRIDRLTEGFSAMIEGLSAESSSSEEEAEDEEEMEEKTMESVATSKEEAEVSRADNGSKVEAMGVEEMNARAQRERDLCNRAIGHRKWAEDHVRRLKNQLKKKEDELSSCKTRLDYAENENSSFKRLWQYSSPKYPLERAQSDHRAGLSGYDIRQNMRPTNLCVQGRCRCLRLFEMAPRARQYRPCRVCKCCSDYAAGHIVNNFPFRKIGALPRLQTESRMDQVLSHVTYAGRYGRSYEPLELVGDGHLTVAVKTMMSRWNNIGAAEIDTIASLVTRNTTLAAMTRHWGLADRIKISPRANLTPEERIKVEGDVFEAWAAAYVEDFKLERGYQKIQEIFDPLCYWVRLEIRARRLFVLDPQA